MNTYNNFFESKGNPAFNVGERVLVHQYGVLATIEAVTWHPERGGEYGYTVKFDKRVRDTCGDKPKMISTGEYGCFGITTSFDKKGQEVADANYYRQSVFMFVHPHYCGNSREFCFDDIDVKATKCEDGSGRWLVVKKQGESTFNYIKTTDELCTMLAELHAGMEDPTEKLKEQWCKAFQIMMEGDGDKLAESEAFANVCEQWGIMTNENDHNGVLKEIARFFRMDYYKKQLEKMMKKHDRLGHMTWSMIEERNKMHDGIMAEIKRRWGVNTYNKVYATL